MKKVFQKEDYMETIRNSKYKTVFDKECGFMRVEPYPTQNELKEYYKGTYFDQGDLVRHDYLNDELIYRVTYLKYIDSIFKFIDKNNNISVLEYGCGVGSFVRSLLTSGHNDCIEGVDGVDISDTAIRVASDNTNSQKVNYYSLDSFIFPIKKYDFVASLEVIEHIPNVQETIEKMSKSINQGGVMFLTTPNYNSFEQRVFKGKWRLFCPPEHINYFTKKTLSRMLSQNGLKVISIEDEFVFSFTMGVRSKLSRILPFSVIRLLTNVKKLLIYDFLNKMLRFVGFEGGKMTVIARKV